MLKQEQSTLRPAGVVDSLAGILVRAEGSKAGLQIAQLGSGHRFFPQLHLSRVCVTPASEAYVTTGAGVAHGPNWGPAPHLSQSARPQSS